MTTKESSGYIEEEELSLKELILKLQDFFKEVILHWKFILLINILFISLMLYSTLKQPVLYPANITFMLDEDDKGGLGGLGGLAASFGFGGMKKGEFNLEKMLALAKSRNIIQQALFAKVNFQGKEDYYANHIIEKYSLHEEWKDSEILKDFTFFSHDSTSLFNRKENNALKFIHQLVIGSESQEPLLSSKINEDTGIVNMKISTTSEDLSIGLVNIIYEKLSTFYINKSVEQQQHSFNLTKFKTDSLYSALNSAQYRFFKVQDSNRNLSLKQYKAEELKLQTKVQILSIAYGKALENLEIADFSLRSQTPFIQSIDLPIAPLTSSKNLMTYIKNIILGGFLGSFLAISFIIGRKIFKDTMKE